VDVKVCAKIVASEKRVGERKTINSKYDWSFLKIGGEGGQDLIILSFSSA
jgi:hypothetical protein